ncbi:MAG: hypothetical protein KF824_03715 [Fimbriimonadaceae bacterium]|nr:MAG: hypothetical protein KF824_03715 [Fimbriimonadaceae bacterium]
MKLAPIPLMAYSLIGLIILMVVGQVGNIPQTVIMFGAGNSLPFNSIIMISVIGGVISMILQQAMLTCTMAGMMTMGRTAMRREIPDVSEGFYVFRKFVPLAITGTLPILVMVPVIALALPVLMNNMSTFRSNASSAEIFSLLSQFMGIYAIGLLLYIIAWAFFFMAPIAVLVEDLPPGEAIMKSVTLASNNFFKIILFLIAYVFLNFVGFLACCIGYFFVQPWLSITSMLIYRDLANVHLVEPINKADGYSPYPREFDAHMPHVGDNPPQSPPTEQPTDYSKPPEP